MIDVVYVVATVVFFASMLGYVVACNRLGDVGAGDELTAQEP